jgi:hypothetical protein
MPVSLPHTFATAGLNTPTTQLDANYAALRDGHNALETTVTNNHTYVTNRQTNYGLLSARPAAGQAGRVFYVTDHGWAPYLDTGSTWIQVGRRVIRKMADQSVNNTATPVADNELVISLTPQQRLTMDGYIRISGHASAGLNLVFYRNGDAEMAWSLTVDQPHREFFAGNGDVASIGVPTGAYYALHLRGIMLAGPAGGNVHLSWAQSTPHASTLTLFNASYLSVTPAQGPSGALLDAPAEVLYDPALLSLAPPIASS